MYARRFVPQADVTGVLPAPVCSQHVAMDATGSLFFTFYQLNTLDCADTDGIKNCVWFDNARRLYHKLLPKRGMLRHSLYVDYDPDVLDQLMTVYMMDVDLSQQLQQQNFRAKKVAVPAILNEDMPVTQPIMPEQQQQQQTLSQL